MASCALSHDPGDAGRDAGTAPAPLAEIEVGLGTDAVPAYGQQDAPVVAWTGSGFYAAWLDRLGGSEAESQIRAAHLDRFGRMTAPPRALVDGSSLNEPRIALASAGELRVVAWIEEGLRVRAVRVGSDGEPMDPAPLLLRENESSGFLSRSFIASDGRDALVGWVHSGAVELVRVPAGGAPTSFDVARIEAPVPLPANGGVTMAWGRDSYLLGAWAGAPYVRRVDRSGLPLDASWRRLDGTSSGAAGGIASNGDGFDALWLDLTATEQWVYLQKLDLSGVPRAAPVAVGRGLFSFAVDGSATYVAAGGVVSRIAEDGSTTELLTVPGSPQATAMAFDPEGGLGLILTAEETLIAHPERWPDFDVHAHAIATGERTALLSAGRSVARFPYAVWTGELFVIVWEEAGDSWDEDIHGLMLDPEDPSPAHFVVARGPGRQRIILGGEGEEVRTPAQTYRPPRLAAFGAEAALRWVVEGEERVAIVGPDAAPRALPVAVTGFGADGTLTALPFGLMAIDVSREIRDLSATLHLRELGADGSARRVAEAPLPFGCTPTGIGGDDSFLLGCLMGGHGGSRCFATQPAFATVSEALEISELIVPDLGYSRCDLADVTSVVHGTHRTLILVTVDHETRFALVDPRGALVAPPAPLGLDRAVATWADGDFVIVGLQDDGRAALRTLDASAAVPRLGAPALLGGIARPLAVAASERHVLVVHSRLDLEERRPRTLAALFAR